MLNKLFFLYSFIITLNPATAADVNKNLKNNMQNRQDTTTSGSILLNDKKDEAWQPFIPTHKWLLQPPSSASPPSLATEPLKHNSNTKNKVDGNKRTHRSYAYNHLYNTNQHNQEEQQTMHHHSNGNYVKRHIKSSVPMAIQSGKHINLKSFVLKTSNNTDNQKQHWQLYKPLDNMETLYPHITIPNDIVSQVQQKSQWQAHIVQENNRKNLHHHVTDIENVQHHHHHHHNQNQKPFTYWQYLVPTQQHFVYNTQQHINRTNTSNTNSTEIENENIRRHDFTILKNSTKSFEDFHRNHILHVDENQVKSLADVGRNSKIKSTPLITILNDNRKYFDNIKDVTRSNKEQHYKRVNDEKDIRNENDVNEHKSSSKVYLNKDKIDNNNHLNVIKFPPPQLVIKTISTTSATPDSATAEATAAKEKFDSLSMENIRQSSTVSVGEVQGREAQLDKDLIKYSFVSTAAPQLTQQPAAIDTRHHTRWGLWNVLTALQSNALLPSSATATTATSKSLSSATEIISGRKVKKIKKKFKKFLLPLLLAYKLKFLALLPLLVGGLVLLVGTTGMAGFFFALFTAVMTLKSSSRNAIVVKKY